MKTEIFLMVEHEFQRTGGKGRTKIKSKSGICRIAWD